MIGFSSLSVPVIGLSRFSVGHMVIQCCDQLRPTFELSSKSSDNR
jgi:hypothetical protein